ncbi:MAG: hypothetical protein LC737_04425, partial [Chloroflexi bacterium]|nr:hypothetical protein [Chloroflexota bacterium]
MKYISFAFALLLFLLSTACIAASKPPLSAHATVTDDPAQHTLTFELMSNAPLARAQLLIGIGDTRTPIDVPLASSPLRYTLSLPPDGLRLPRSTGTLRYAWMLRGADGQLLTLAESLSSPQLTRDESPVVLQWQEARVSSLTIRYLPSTPAARDLDSVKEVARNALSRAALALDATIDVPLTLYLLPRIFWQGGADFDRTMFVSYADRGFTGVSLDDYIAHEGAHALTQSWGNLGSAGGLLAEGVAVYATGGHYQPDLLDESAATLVQSPLFIPPTILRRDFSNQQHEIAYTESGSFIKYLLDHFGIEKLRALFRKPNDWQTLYGKDFDALTRDWLAALRA